jgi:AcrR family transcriptional regulator
MRVAISSRSATWHAVHLPLNSLSKPREYESVAATREERKAGKREAQKVEREGRIFAAACELFAQKGYEAVGMDDLAKRAGLSVGTLYNYYDSKPAVLLAVLRQGIDVLVRSSTRLLKAPPDDEYEGIMALAESYLRALSRDRDLWRNLWAGALASPAPYETGFFELDDVLVEKFTELIAHYQEQGRLDKGIDAKAGAAVLYAYYSQSLMAFLWDPRITLRRLLADCRQATEVMLRGLAVRSE